MGKEDDRDLDKKFCTTANASLETK
jgi:hypothetical protein